MGSWSSSVMGATGTHDSRRYDSLIMDNNYSLAADYNNRSMLRSNENNNNNAREDDDMGRLFNSRMVLKAPPPPPVQHLFSAKAAYSAVKPVQWTTTFNEKSSSTRPYVHQATVEPKVQTEAIGTDLGNGANTKKSLSHFQIGIYGWRKRCLYLMLVLLVCIMILNFYITLWFIGCLRINSEGIGIMKIFDTGIMVDGITYFMDTLVTSKIQAQPGKPISMVTSDKFTVTVRDPNGREISRFHLSNDSVEFITKALSIKNEKGEIMFSVDNERVRYGAKEIKITGKNGAFVNKAIQTPLIKGHFKEDLSLLSIHRNIEVIGSSGVLLQAPAGDISLTCLTGVRIRATDGSIQMDSRRIFMPNLPVANRTKTACVDPIYIPTAATTTETTSSNQQQTDKDLQEIEQHLLKQYTKIGMDIPTRAVRPQMVYQVCMCANGKMFLAFANGECTTDNESSVCR